MRLSAQYFLRTASEYLPEDTEKARLRLNQSEFFPAAEEKTDSESSCSFFGKRKAITRKNALCLRRKRTRKAVVSFSKKEKRLSEKNENNCKFVCVYSSLLIVINYFRSFASRAREKAQDDKTSRATGSAQDDNSIEKSGKIIGK